MEKWKNRLADHPIDELFLTRVSTRAFDLNKKVSKDDLMSCFEAARWAPSSFNNQPWRFVYAEKGSKAYEAMIGSMVPFNQNWCKNAPVIILIVSRKQMTHNNSNARTHSLDTGFAYASFVLQAHAKGLATHALDGFNHDVLKSYFKINEVYQIEALLTLGYPGDVESLPSDLKAKEVPTDRFKIESFISEGEFPFN